METSNGLIYRASSELTGSLQHFTLICSCESPSWEVGRELYKSMSCHFGPLLSEDAELCKTMQPSHFLKCLGLHT